MIELLIGIIEAIVALIVGVIEAIASLFTVGGEALGAGEAIVILAALIIEIIFWLVLWLIELVASLIQWRKPKIIAKPVIWRPAKKQKQTEQPDSAEQ